MIKEIAKRRELINSMVKQEVNARYAGSFLGWVWSFIRPFVMILVFWFIFSVGFRVRPTNDVPFVVWLTAGLAAWYLFAEIIGGAHTLVVSQANLIKKTVFSSEILPIVRILSSLVFHLIFLVILFGLLLFQKMDISLFYLQATYYLFCMSILALGLSWMISALHVFIRDVGHMVGVILQVGFWATPIFWNSTMMGEKVQMFLKLNPMFYIIQGYRDSFIYFVPFWKHPYQTLYFWVLTLAILWLGYYVFLKLKPQFADVL